MLTLYNTLFFPCNAAAPRGPWPPHSRGFYFSHNEVLQSVGLLWTSDRLVAGTSIWQHTTLTTDKHTYHNRDSNPQAQHASGSRHTP